MTDVRASGVRRSNMVCALVVMRPLALRKVVVTRSGMLCRVSSTRVPRGRTHRTVNDPARGARRAEVHATRPVAPRAVARRATWLILPAPDTRTRVVRVMVRAWFDR